MKTRQEYLSGNCSHSEYYSQFVTPSIISVVKSRIGESKIKASKDPHFNDIPLALWDALDQSQALRGAAKAVKESGDFLTLSGIVCIAKEAARQIKSSLSID